VVVVVAVETAVQHREKMPLALEVKLCQASLLVKTAQTKLATVVAVVAGAAGFLEATVAWPMAVTLAEELDPPA
jgi:hypothetical protein